MLPAKAVASSAQTMTLPPSPLSSASDNRLTPCPTQLMRALRTSGLAPCQSPPTRIEPPPASPDASSTASPSSTTVSAVTTISPPWPGDAPTGVADAGPDAVTGRSMSSATAGVGAVGATGAGVPAAGLESTRPTARSVPSTVARCSALTSIRPPAVPLASTRAPASTFTSGALMSIEPPVPSAVWALVSDCAVSVTDFEPRSTMRPSSVRWAPVADILPACVSAAPNMPTLPPREISWPRLIASPPASILTRSDG